MYTDAGVFGTGEACWGVGVPELTARTRPFRVGENPFDVDRLCEHLAQKTAGEGSVGGVTVTRDLSVPTGEPHVAGSPCN